MNNILSGKAIVSAALVGIVGAAGMYLYEQFYAEKRRAMLVKDMERLNRQVANLQSELDNLRDVQKESQILRAKHRKARRHKRSASSAPAPDLVDGSIRETSYNTDTTEYTTDYQSVVSSDLDSDEFYDLHSDSDDSSTRNKPSLAGGDQNQNSTSISLVGQP